ncbi:MAG: Acetyltransferase domain, partial [Frankiales bacterium]|nr:Acetyltransferase domain [Frankiales bacterium]
ARLRAPDALLLVAEQDGVVAGVLLAGLARDDDGRPLPGVLELELLAVAPPAQRTGVGTALLAALLARYPRLQAWTGPDATGVLARAGLEATGRTREPDLQQWATRP